MVEVICASCKRKYLRPPARVREAKQHGWKQFCSPACLASSKRMGRQLSCSNQDCGKVFYRRSSELVKAKEHYCSRSCAVQVNNHLSPKRTKKTRGCALRGCENHIIVRQKYCSRNCYSLARSKFSPDQLLEKLRSAAKRLGRTPARREMPIIASKCLWSFGSWSAALAAAGLKLHRGHDQRMFKRMRTKARDGHSCDSISEAIIDNWLAEHGIPHERDAQYPTSGHKADWYIPGLQIFIEYFGLAHDSKHYDQTIVLKRNLCKKANIKLIELYATDLYPVQNLAAKIVPAVQGA